MNPKDIIIGNKYTLLNSERTSPISVKPIYCIAGYKEDPNLFLFKQEENSEMTASFFAEDVIPYIEPKEEVSEGSNPNEPYELLVEILNKAGARNNLCITEFGYSQIERDIVEGLIGWQKEQTKALQESHDKLLDALISVRENKYAINDYQETIENAKSYAEKQVI